MKPLHLPILTVLMFVFAGCTRIYYTPTTQNVPLMRKSDEIQVSIGDASGRNYEAFSYQIAYSPVKYMGIMANGFYTKGEDQFSEQPSGNLTEAGVGLYLPYAKRSVVDLYGGYGSGKVSYTWGDPVIPLSIERYFLQNSIGFAGRHFEFAYSNRLSIVEYGNFNEFRTHLKNTFCA